MTMNTSTSMAMDESSKSSESQLKIVLPGDDVTSLIQNIVSSSTSSNTATATTTTKKSKTVKLGMGLSYRLTQTGTDTNDNQHIYATIAGRLQHFHHIKSSTLTFYVLHNHKRYKPLKNDFVIAIVEERMGMYYRMTIPNSIYNSNQTLLHITSFDGATKKNRPVLNKGDLVYGRIVVCNDYMSEIEISCMVTNTNDSSNTRSSGSGGVDVMGGASTKDWMTNENTFGQLKNGTCISISIGLAQELLHPNNVVLDELASSSSSGSNIPFEVCIGMNGYLYVHSSRPEYTIMICNAILNSQVMTEGQVRSMVQSLIQTVQNNLISEVE
mmetsp:Transcript_12360/g.15256  ORF Transcript_12360/g.15256 Transcript_12360/m.15256 type:complete len:327 (+) Transcript_12360:229-1209(+)